MKFKLLFAWYDFWIGAYYDRAKHTLYVLPLPMFGVVITLPHRWEDSGVNPYGTIVEQRCRCGEYRYHLFEHRRGFCEEPDWQPGKHPYPNRTSDSHNAMAEKIP